MLQVRGQVQMYKRYGKRLIDIILACSGLVLLAPLLLLIAIWVKLDSKGPVLFKQKRTGRDKTYFNILKFRTMRTGAPKDVPTHLLANPEDHITRSGRFLRRTSLDELPQIANVLVGNMSIVGPRPALWNQDDLIAERDKYSANAVRPGITGWAQINGRDVLTIPVKAKLDGEYVRRMSLLFDCRCFFGTILAVLKHEGIVEGMPGELQALNKGIDAQR